MTYRSYRINCLSLCVSFFAAFLFCILFILSPAGYAEVTLDGTLGPQKTLTGPDYQINAEDGRIINHTNLFHSFGKFTIDTNESASFSGPDSISNIIGRVTGGTQSWIDGLIRSTIPDANLFLLNPSGILFGPNASLDVQGSFHVSTADFIRLGENGLFYSDPSQESILTVDPPASFGFLGDNPAGISVQESELQVPDGKTLSLIGGDIDIVGDGESSFASAELCAPSGRIHIASVASAGEVIANAPDKSPKLQVDSFDQLGDITISQGALIDTSGDSGGAVLIKGGRLMIGSSYIVSNTLGNFNGAAVGIDIDLKGDFIADASTLQTATVGQGASGAIRIASETLEMHDSSIEAFSYYGPGDGGDIEIKSDNLAVEDYSTIKSYTYRSPGKGGNIEINAGSLHLKEGGQIYVKTYGSGDSGDLSVAAKSINLSSTDNFSRPASLGATTANSSSGQGGDLRLTTDSLEVRDGAQIDITTFGAGDAGNLEITADTMLLSGINGYNAPAAIFARARGNRGGNAGQVHLTIGNLEVLDGGTIFRDLVDTWPDDGGVYWLSLLYQRIDGIDVDDSYNGFSLFINAQELLYIGKPWGTKNLGLDGTGVENVPSEIDAYEGGWLVVKLMMSGDAENDDAYLWIDPDPSVEPDTANADAHVGWKGSDGFNRVRIGSGNTPEQAECAYDEIRIAHSYSSLAVETGVADFTPQAARQFGLMGNYPNPFNPTTNISYVLNETQRTSLTIYDILGRKVCTLVEAVQVPGEYKIQWNGLDYRGQAAPSGIYFYQLVSGDLVKAKKMTLIQ